VYDAVRNPEARRGRTERAIRALIILTLLVNVVYLGALLLPGDPAPVLVNIVLSLVAQWVPVSVFWLVAVRTRFERPEVILAAAGVTFNAAGDTFYAFAMNSSGELPSPSLADLGYLLYYPLTMAALLVLVVRQSHGSVKSALFDGAVASLGAAAVLAVVLGPVFTDATSGATFLNGAIAALYPLFDLLLITAVVAISASPALRLGPRWQFLVLGFLLFAGADVAYALLTDAGAYTAGTPMDALWTAGVASAAIWVDGVTRLEPDTGPPAECADPPRSRPRRACRTGRAADRHADPRLYRRPGARGRHRGSRRVLGHVAPSSPHPASREPGTRSPTVGGTGHGKEQHGPHDEP
jgi:hypothetical protein